MYGSYLNCLIVPGQKHNWLQEENEKTSIFSVMLVYISVVVQMPSHLEIPVPANIVFLLTFQE